MARKLSFALIFSLVFSTAPVLAFVGPGSLSSGSGTGALGSDVNNNISIGTSTPASTTRLYVVAASSTSAYYALQVTALNGNPLLLVRADGSIAIATSSFSGGALTVGGTLFAGNFSGTLSASNITSGVFGGSGSGANFSVPGNLGVATSSQVGLPQPLSVYGNGYISGSLGIATTSPLYALSVAGDINATGVHRTNGVPGITVTCPAGQVLATTTVAGGIITGGSCGTASGGASQWTTSGSNIYYNTGNVGIGTTTPETMLHIATPGSNGILITGSSSTLGPWVQIHNRGAGGHDWYILSNGSANAGGSGALQLVDTTGGGNVVLNTTGNVGIGTLNPGYRLDVSGNGAAFRATGAVSEIESLNEGHNATTSYNTVNWYSGTGTLVNKSDNFVWYVNENDPITQNRAVSFYQYPSDSLGGCCHLKVAFGIDSSGNDITSIPGTLTIGGGSGKITVGTVDPVYTINGEKFATYDPGMTGQKEETVGVVNLSCSGNECKYAIDFNNLENGSDLWLFNEATDFGTNMEHLAVLLTPSFDGSVWYKKDAVLNTLTIYGSAAGEVSYRFTANRFDWQKWPNASEDPSVGFTVPGKNAQLNK